MKGPRIGYSIRGNPSDDLVINLNNLKSELFRIYLNLHEEDLLWLISPEDIERFSEEIRKDSWVADLYLKTKNKKMCM